MVNRTYNEEYSILLSRTALSKLDSSRKYENINVLINSQGVNGLSNYVVGLASLIKNFSKLVPSEYSGIHISGIVAPTAGLSYYFIKLKVSVRK